MEFSSIRRVQENHGKNKCFVYNVDDVLSFLGMDGKRVRAYLEKHYSSRRIGFVSARTVSLLLRYTNTREQNTRLDNFIRSATAVNKLNAIPEQATTEQEHPEQAKRILEVFTTDELIYELCRRGFRISLSPNDK